MAKKDSLSETRSQKADAPGRRDNDKTVCSKAAKDVSADDKTANPVEAGDAEPKAEAIAAKTIIDPAAAGLIAAAVEAGATAPAPSGKETDEAEPTKEAEATAETPSPVIETVAAGAARSEAPVDGAKPKGGKPSADGIAVADVHRREAAASIDATNPGETGEAADAASASDAKPAKPEGETAAQPARPPQAAHGKPAETLAPEGPREPPPGLVAHHGGAIPGSPATADAAGRAHINAIPPTPVHMTPLVIGLQAMEGAREFSIRLDPAELGRVDVKLTISEDGRVEASLEVDRVETLALLQRDARTLERAFDQAGLTADSNSIRFSLRQDQQSGQQGAERNDSGAASSEAARNGETDAAVAAQSIVWRGHVGPSGVDIRV